MRAALTFLALAALFASRAGAFDRAEWLGKRGMLDGEAGRLEKAYAKYAVTTWWQYRLAKMRRRLMKHFHRHDGK